MAISVCWLSIFTADMDVRHDDLSNEDITSFAHGQPGHITSPGWYLIRWDKREEATDPDPYLFEWQQREEGERKGGEGGRIYLVPWEKKTKLKVNRNCECPRRCEGRCNSNDEDQNTDPYLIKW